MDPKVSIVIVNYFHPEVIDICLRSMKDHTWGVDYEVIVVDNGSDEETLRQLQLHVDEERIDKLIRSPENLLYSGGNNLGVEQTNPASKYLLLLNSDVGFLRDDWLTKIIAWMEDTIEYHPTIWGQLAPNKPSKGPKDIISVGWSHDGNVPNNVRIEGWCLLMRREAWRPISTDFPWHYGMDEMVTNAVRDGFKCGVLFNYPTYLVHREGASGKPPMEIENERWPDLVSWYSDITIETLDFYLGPDEHSSYLEW